MLDRLAEWFNPEKDNTPNRLTIGMGKLIRKAREQAGMSQAELARQIYRRQASLSNIENGLMEVDVSTLIYLAGALTKPITYFFPQAILQQLEPERLTPEQRELLMQAVRLSAEELTGIIAQVKALAELQDSRSIVQARELADILDDLPTPPRKKAAPISRDRSKGKRR